MWEVFTMTQSIPGPLLLSRRLLSLGVCTALPCTRRHSFCELFLQVASACGCNTQNTRSKRQHICGQTFRQSLGTNETLSDGNFQWLTFHNLFDNESLMDDVGSDGYLSPLTAGDCHLIWLEAGAIDISTAVNGVTTPPSPGLLTDNTRDWYQVGAESLHHHWHTGHHGDVVLSPLLRTVSWSLVWGVWLCLGCDNDWDVLWCGGHRHQAAADQAACLHRLSAAPGELRAGLGRAALYTRPVTSILTHTI